MKIKKIILLIVVLVLTGCSAEVNLKIDKNNNVSQDVKISQNINILKEYGGTPEEFIKETIDYNSANDIGYKRKNFYDDNYFGTVFTKENTNICDEIKSSYFSSFFYEINCEENEKDYNISGKTIFAYCSEELVGCNDVDYVNLTVELPQEAISSDADIIEGNKYTWRYDSTKEGTFNLKFKKYKVHDDIISKITSDKETNNTIKTMAILLGGFIAVIVIVVIILYGKYKNKKIDY